MTGLYRRRRSDRGQPRKKQEPLLARAVELKKEQPYRSDKVINRILQREFGRTLPRSTLYHHLRRQGATRRKLGVSTQKVRCRWSREQPGALWVGDFEHGPPVMEQGKAIKTHLSAWIYCHSRYFVEARYYAPELQTGGLPPPVSSCASLTQPTALPIACRTLKPRQLLTNNQRRSTPQTRPALLLHGFYVERENNILELIDCKFSFILIFIVVVGMQRQRKF